MVNLKPVYYKNKKIVVMRYSSHRGPIYDVRIGEKVWQTHCGNKECVIKCSKNKIDGKPASHIIR